MVIDPFSALSLASSIVQFVDFGIKLTSKSVELYKSAAGEDEDGLNLGSVAQRLTSIASRLETSTKDGEEIARAEDEKDLRRLALSCRKDACELITMIDSLRIDPKISGLARGFQSLHQAFRHIGMKSRLEAFEGRLNTHRSEITLHIVSTIGVGTSSVQREVEKLQNTIHYSETNSQAQMNELLAILETIKADLREVDGINGMRFLHVHLSDAESMASQLAREQVIISSLRFPSMHTRYADIKEPHQRTFNWIFEASSTSIDDSRQPVKFIDWLRQPHKGEGIYWVSGKAASGKSTLMKFISSHSEVKAALKQWTTNSETLVVASFYFWYAGTKLQKTQEGLMRSLLYEVLRQCPGVIAGVTPDRWTSSILAEQDDWTKSELLDTLLRLTTQMLSAKFCFFIDGVDEYSGDHNDLLRILEKVAALPSVKICLSSRPWEVFKRRYDHDPERRLYLQDSTRKDIELFALSELEANDNYRYEQANDPRYGDLVREITDKAQGVFLWVFLVVRSLIEGLQNGDSLEILHKRLDDLPHELEQLFARMIAGVEKVYKHKVAQTFHTALAAKEPLSIMAYSFMDDEKLQSILKEVRHPCSNTEIYLRQDRTARQINAVSKGLLEVSKDPDSHIYFRQKIDFLHRTVRDFLTGQQSRLFQDVGTNFSTHTSVCYALLAELKCCPLTEHDPISNPVAAVLENFFYHARQSEGHARKADDALLDETGRTYNSFPSLVQRLGSFVNLCVFGDLYLYVESKIVRDRALVRKPDSGPSMLECALEDEHKFPQPQKTDLFASPGRIPMVERLLKHGANPNDVASTSTVWAKFLYSVTEPRALWRHQMEIAKSLLQLLLDHGADPNVTDAKGTPFTGRIPNLRKPASIGYDHEIFLLEIIKLLLAHSADPNLQSTDGLTPWIRFLNELSLCQQCHIYLEPRCMSLLYEIAEMMVLNGASFGMHARCLLEYSLESARKLKIYHFDIETIKAFFISRNTSHLVESIWTQNWKTKTTSPSRRHMLKLGYLKRLFEKTG
ncbi:MAG: hypothetical protein Q9165_002734 [Trypethelium subeluteriae]